MRHDRRETVAKLRLAAVVHLDAKAVARTALAAFERGDLQAQKRPGKGCYYGAGCAIGKSLSRDDAARFDRQEHAAVRTLIQRGLVATDDEASLIAIQRAHDAATTAKVERAERLAELGALLREAAR